MRRTWIVTRWERESIPDGYDSTHCGAMEVTCQEPPRGEGWVKVVRDVTTPDCTLLSSEKW